MAPSCLSSWQRWKTLDCLKYQRLGARGLHRACQIFQPTGTHQSCPPGTPLPLTFKVKPPHTPTPFLLAPGNRKPRVTLGKSLPFLASLPSSLGTELDAVVSKVLRCPNSRVLFFLTVVFKYSLHTFWPFKSTTQWLLVYLQICTPITTIGFRTSSTSQKETWYP